MFRHRDKGRTHTHNVRLALLLSTVAGIVNIMGVLSFKTLTTNVTGHFAFFSEELMLGNYGMAVVSFLYVLCFLIGAFLASTSMEITSANRTHYSYIPPISIEIVLLIVVCGSTLLKMHAIPSSCMLLLAMGVQNALVTRVSGSVVRTTHLTGMFTDLGIELSQVMFRRKEHDVGRLRRNILLRATIIGGFFLGGIAGALVHRAFGIAGLLLPIFLLSIALYSDRMRLSYYQIKRKARVRG